MSIKNPTKPIITLAAGMVLGALLMFGYWHLQTDSLTANDTASASEPLYWVAPMDSSYRRDGPGKSPMGMDLVPVYAGDTGAEGVVTINSAVEQNIGVRLARVSTGPFTDEIRTVGYVGYNEDTLVHIHPRVTGWIEKLHVQAEGDPVALNQPLYEVYSPALINAQEEFLLALQRDNSLLIDAARDRLRALQISEQTIRTLQKTRSVPAATTFYAPQQGVVDNLAIREGFYVTPNTKLMSIGALDEVWVEAEVFERQASLVKTGAAVTMHLDYLPGRLWEGAVDYIYPTLDPVSRTLRLRLRFANPDRALKPNMFAQLSIATGDAVDALLIPREALIRTGEGNRVVLALGNGRYQSVAVRVGRISRDTVEVLEGLQADQQIVSSAQFLLDSESSKSADLQRLSSEHAAPTTTGQDHDHDHDHDHDLHEHPGGAAPPKADEHDHEMEHAGQPATRSPSPSSLAMNKSNKNSDSAAGHDRTDHSMHMDTETAP